MDNQGYVCIFDPTTDILPLSDLLRLLLHFNWILIITPLTLLGFAVSVMSLSKFIKLRGAMLCFSHLRHGLSYTAGGHLVALIQHQFYFPYRRDSGLT